jgi:hypothetical protein
MKGLNPWLLNAVQFILWLTLTAAAGQKPSPKPEPSGVIPLPVGSRAGRFAGRGNSAAHSFLARYADRESLEIRCVRSAENA